MRIVIKGSNSVISRKELRKALQWMLRKLMSKRLCSHLTITLINDTNLNLKGVTEVYFPERKHRSFTIRIRASMPKHQQLLTLAHEAVHIKQYATGELRNTHDDRYIKWDDQIFDVETIEYEDWPWEIEAFGREPGLYHRYLKSLKQESH